MSKSHKQASPRLNKARLTEEVVAYFQAHAGELIDIKTIFRELHLKTHPAKLLCMDVLDDLLMDDFIIEQAQMRYRLADKTSVMEGTFQRKHNGKNTFLPDDGGEPILVAERNSMHAMDGDRVRIQMMARRRGHVREAQVTNILKRADKQFVGKLSVSRDFAFVLTEDRTLSNDIFIPKGQLKGGKSGDKVIAKIVEWPEGSKNPIGKIVEVLGQAGDNETEMHAILAEFGLPYTYPKAAEDAARHIDATITAADQAEREDLRDRITFTIDPRDAKDFDDALSFKVLKEGALYEIGVHIADVSHYVTEGSVIDKEAVKRGTSVYLVDRTIPMLPERLCNEICSLRPDEDKLTYSVIFEINDRAEVKNWHLAHTITRSDRRFTYEEVQALLEARGEASPEDYHAPGDHAPQPGAEFEGDKAKSLRPTEDFATELITLNRLAKLLRQRRFAAGAVDFDRPEVRFDIDEKGHPIGTYYKVAKDANKLIEEFMLLANRTVAESIGKVARQRGQKNSVKPKVLPYRIHEQPDPDKLLNLSQFVAKAGNFIEPQPPAPRRPRTEGAEPRGDGGTARHDEGKILYYQHRPLWPRLRLLHTLHIAHPPLPRPHGAPPAHALCRGRALGQSGEIRGAVRAVLRHGADGSPGRARQHQVQAGGVHGRQDRARVRRHYLGHQRIRYLRRTHRL